MNKKKIRSKGKIQLSKYFQELKKGNNVSVNIETAVQPKFPKRLQGKTGIIEEKRGRNYIISVNEQNKRKRFLIHPVHLNKIKNY